MVVILHINNIRLCMWITANEWWLDLHNSAHRGIISGTYALLGSTAGGHHLPATLYIQFEVMAVEELSTRYLFPSYVCV